LRGDNDGKGFTLTGMLELPDAVAQKKEGRWTRFSPLITARFRHTCGLLVLLHWDSIGVSVRVLPDAGDLP